MDGNKESEQDFFTPLAPAGSDSASDSPVPIQWTASEFLHHQKSPVWYVYALIVIAGLAAVLYLFSRDLIGPVALVILGGLLMVGASRKPRTVAYSVDEHGITIGNKQYAYQDFQSFSVLREDQIESISLLPSKRFMPLVSLYFSPEDGQKIFDLIGEYLPFEQRERDQIDKFLHKIKF